ncbi:Ger(x)C family spore germination protein [Halalkalibacter kiskunsagensis]|uniref:Ger(X)C family spore germination protein n=1 Tax=Halalkalibacter kiskunsagensis TaxID=1548599 RepID=A0ABV6KG87_9BACI
MGATNGFTRCAFAMRNPLITSLNTGNGYVHCFKGCSKRSKPDFFERPLKRLTALLFLSLFLLSGCWNIVELENLAIVSAIGIDAVPESEEYQVTLQVLNPATIAKGPMGAGGERLPTTNFQSVGNSVVEAIRSAAKKVPREIFLGHVQHVIISEEVAQEDLQKVINFIRRDPDIRLTTRIFIAKGHSAQTVVNTVQSLVLIPANAVMGKLTTNQSLWSSNIEVNILDVYSALDSKGREPLINGILIEGEVDKGIGKPNYQYSQMLATIVIEEMALFRDGKLQRWITKDITRGISQILNEIENAIVAVDYSQKKEHIPIELIQSKTTIQTKFDGSKPTIDLHVNQIGNIADASEDIDLSKKEVINELEGLWSEKTKEELLAVIDIAQKAGSDVFGFGDKLDIQHPEEWKKVQDNWSEVFPECDINVHVETVIRRSGMMF